MIEDMNAKAPADQEQDLDYQGSTRGESAPAKPSPISIQRPIEEQSRCRKRVDEDEGESIRSTKISGTRSAPTWPTKAIMKSDAEVNKRRIDEMQKRSQAFGDLFAANLIEAADGGFKAVLKSWTLTLEQMVLKTAATNLFESMFKQGFTSSAGGWVGKIAGVLGLAGGGPVMAGTPYLVGERGPEMFVPQCLRLDRSQRCRWRGHQPAHRRAQRERSRTDRLRHEGRKKSGIGRDA